MNTVLLVFLLVKRERCPAHGLMDPGEGAATKPQRKALRKKANLVFIACYGFHLLLPCRAIHQLDGQLRYGAGSKVRTKPRRSSSDEDPLKAAARRSFHLL